MTTHAWTVVVPDGGATVQINRRIVRHAWEITYATWCEASSEWVEIERQTAEHNVIIDMGLPAHTRHALTPGMVRWRVAVLGEQGQTLHTMQFDTPPE